MSPGQALELGATFGTFSKFLHGVEPGWLKDLPATVRIIVYYAVGTMALEIAYGLVRALLKGLGVVSERLASLFGRSIVFGYGELAQSIGRWVIVSQGWQQDVMTPWKMEWLDNKLAMDLETPVSRDPSSRNTPRLCLDSSMPRTVHRLGVLPPSSQREQSDPHLRVVLR